jgi:hypothetical protein
MTKAPATITYASVVSRETVCITLLMAALNDLYVKVEDVLSAYITAPITKKVWTVLGPEFGIDAGKSAIIVRTLYGLKSAGAAFHAHLASFMRQMGYTSCNTGPDIYLGAKLKMTQLDNGIWAWELSPSKYVTQAVKNCAKHLTDKLNNHFCLPQRADNPFPYDYCPDVDISYPLTLHILPKDTLRLHFILCLI